jgi:hypothetical protein
MATIITRAGKGSPLTFAEADANFTNLNTDKLEAPGGIVNQPVTFQDVVNLDNLVNVNGGPLVVSNSGLSGLPSIEVGSNIGSHRIKISSQSGVNGGSGVEFDGGADHYIGHGGLSYGSNDLAIVTNLGTSGTNNLRWYNFNTELMRLTSTGQLGIGTTSISYPLQVNDSITTATPSNLLGLTTASGGVLTFAVSDRSIANPTWSINSGTSEPIALSQGGNERLRIDASGRLLVGTSVARTVASTSRQSLIQSEIVNSGLNASASFVTNGNDTVGSILSLAKSRGTSVGGVSAVQAGDTLGVLRFAGADGTNISPVGAEVYGQTDGVVATGSVPGRLLFTTTSVGNSSPTERMRIDSSGNVGIGTTSFGTSAVRTLAVANGTEPSAAVADTIQIGSVDLTAGNTIPYVRAEGTGITGAGITSTTVTHKIAIKVNGTVYYLLATTNGT